MQKKLIILLSAKRCGSTAIFNMFQKSKSIKIFNVNQKIDNWEIQFWNLGSQAIKGYPIPFIKRMKKSLPFLQLPKKINEKNLFKLMDHIFQIYGPVLFDKSPQYLGNKEAIKLIKKYTKKRKINLKFIGLIRDPKDALMSQYILWRSYVKKDSLKKREKIWLEQYKHLEEILLKQKFPIIKYEEFSTNTDFQAKKIFRFCEENFDAKYISHVKPVSIGRYSKTIFFLNKKRWNWSEKFEEHLKKYNYYENSVKFEFFKSLDLFFKELKLFFNPTIRKKIRKLMIR